MRHLLNCNGKFGHSFNVQIESGHRSRRVSTSAIFMVVGLACGALASFGSAAKAGDLGATSDPIAALRSYVQTVDAAGPTSEPQSLKGLPKLAEAGSLLEFLQGGGHDESGAASMPATAPKAKGKAGAAMPMKADVAATTVGSKVCLGCHTDQAKAFSYTLMGRLQQQGKMDCETCHGPGSAHVKAGGGRGVGGIISFRSDDTSRSAEENNQLCLGCHDKGQRIFWPGSTHEERGLACTNCHTIMKAVSRQNQLKTAYQPETCFQCHKDRRAQMYQSSHMPMRDDEAKVVCSDCHNPHGSSNDQALLKKDTVNQVCYTCHAEKRGPFLFEHEPVRENCLNCHDPHGSVNQYSLKLVRQRLCTECHNLMHTADGMGNSFNVGQSCQNCHTAVHGSNSPQGSLLFR